MVLWILSVRQQRRQADEQDRVWEVQQGAEQMVDPKAAEQ